ncbi:MAG: substrate-binding domain-containing protein [Spirochaetaceae bacterium]
MGKISRVLIFILCLILLLLFINTKWNDITDKKKEQLSIIVVLKSLNPSDGSMWSSVIEGLNTAATDFNINLEILGTDDENDIFGQIEILERIPELNPDAVIVAATDNRFVIPVINKIINKKIPLVFIDSFAEEMIGDGRIGMDNYAAGESAGKRVLENLRPDSLLAILSFTQGSSTAIDREKGILDTLNGDMNLFPTYYSGGSIEVSYNQTLNLLKRVTGLKCIVTLNNTVTIGAAMAIEEMNRSGDVTLIGFGSSLDILGYIQKDIIKETIAQKPFNVGYLGIKSAIEIINKEDTINFLDTGHLVINKENMFTVENQKILFPIQNK